MNIYIDYESSWRNSFLDGNNNETLPKNGRDFIASMTNLKKEENYIEREVTIDTVMGLLNRLIGDQRKLYQSRKDDKYYFKDLESKITFIDKPQSINSEQVYLRNMKGSYDQNSFTGSIKADDPIFTANYSPELWGLLFIDFDDLCHFIINGVYQPKQIDFDPLIICDQFDLINKEKAKENTDLVAESLKVLQKSFPEVNYFNNKGLVPPVYYYCSALYLQLIRLESKYDLSKATNKNGNISGISKRGFTKKDFMNAFTTGDKKRIWGNPYIRKVRVKGEGEVKSMLIKASGKLEVSIDIERQKAKELRTLIENAGVSSFYLGKKGLAYVSNIRV